jgi:hypothetical protein
MHPGPVVSEITIFPDSPVLRIEYPGFCFQHNMRLQPGAKPLFSGNRSRIAS